MTEALGAGGPSLRVVGTTSMGIAALPGLAAMLGAERVVYMPPPGAEVDAFVGWGAKRNTALARAWARRLGVPFVRLEDGFLRSVRLGVDGAPPLSIVLDEDGIYYDATRPSKLERLLAGVHPESAALEQPDVLERAGRCMSRMRALRLSKYNAAPRLELGPREGRSRVLVVDQTPGDLSLELGLAPVAGVDALVEAALADHPDAEVLIKTHPDAIARGALTEHRGRPRVRVISSPAEPISLLEQVDHVYVMTSLLGFEALALGKPVTCFGAPFYAGWGLTDDRGPRVDRRGVPRTVEQLFAAAYLIYARYYDPETKQRAEIEDVIDHLGRQVEHHRAIGGRTIGLGFTPWKHGFVPHYAASPAHGMRFVSGEEELISTPLEAGENVVVWGPTVPDAVARHVARSGAGLRRMEDGFLRSVGLGSNHAAPASLVADSRGIYFDPTRPSDLEHILEHESYSEDELRRARALREHIVNARVSKYNSGTEATVGPPEGDPRKVVFVIGQVEDDASIRLGCVDVRTNLGLLEATRAACPDAYIVYRPHPDVTCGNREGVVGDDDLARLVDEVAIEPSLPTCLDAADEVHTMTSLVGFESLLRGLPVHVYGRPFYGGWGLTNDRQQYERRTRRLALDELVAGALIRYPIYVHPESNTITTPERIVAYLERARRQSYEPPAARSRGTLMLRAKNATVNTLRGSATAKRLAARARLVASAANAHLNGWRPLYDRADLPPLGVERALLLQGPSGPFFRRFGQELRTNGVEVTKVNLYAGDLLFYPGPEALSYRGRPEEFDEWIEALMRGRKIDGIFLFGDCRGYHRRAIAAARRLGASVWVFEEGYLRPDWLTLERDGVNGHSPMSRSRETYTRWMEDHTPPAPEARSVGASFRYGAFYSTLSGLAHALDPSVFPHYEHHRPLDGWWNLGCWARGAARKVWFRRRERGVLDKLLERWDGRYFFVPLQVHCDFQLTHSPYDDVVDFIEEVVTSFAERAPADHALVFKHHPMDRPFREYGALFRRLAEAHGLGERLIYVHDLDLDTLLKRARGTVTINSTVGLASLSFDTPTKVMGDAIYDIDGLTHQGSLESMWNAPEAPDPGVVEAFRAWLLHHNQANGNIMKRVPGARTPTGVRWWATPAAGRR